MFVKVFKLENDNEALATFPTGMHVLGRGPSLQCDDKRVSRNHATLCVNNENVKIISTHVNPCFLKMAGSKTVTILSKDSSTVLSDGDAFAFLPDSFWFKVKIIAEVSPDSQVKDDGIEDIESLKRHLNNSEEEPDDKRRKVEDNQQEHNVSETDNDEKQASSNNAEPKNVTTENDDNVDNSSSNEHANSNDELDKPVKEEENNEQKETSNNDEQAASSASTQVKSRRERCWYGAECYRKNPAHRQEFTHPGDSDFESDPDDNRPSCSFGAACYRKNKDHRREYKHPLRDPPSKQQKKRTRKKVDRLYAGGDDSADLSDLSEDPYEDDGDSDEYEEDSASDDSDYEDSQMVDENSENVRILVKEAKRFTKK